LNIRMQYLYRDAGNYKQWGEVIFKNRRGSSPAALEDQVRSLLIDQDFFEAEVLNIPTLYFDEPISDLDRQWHEFHSLEACEDAATDRTDRDIEELLNLLQSIKRN